MLSNKFFLTLTSLMAFSLPVMAASKDDPSVKIEKIGDSGIARITLTEDAAKRLGIQTSKVQQEQDGDDKSKVTIPYRAILYDNQGKTWAYTNPAPLVFLREQIEIDEIDDELAVLQKGPAIGTEVVTIGVAELYGVEKGIGK